MDWNASAYHEVSGPVEAMGVAVLGRLPLRGDETVLDAGCGTGRVTATSRRAAPARAVDRRRCLPGDGRGAREVLGTLADVRQADLLELELGEPVDAVFSTATFHWILDHERLFCRLFAALRPGGCVVAQCGGYGNIRQVLGAADEVAALPEYAASFEGWSRASRFASAEETSVLLERAGFGDIRCWLEPNPVVPADPLAYLTTIALRDHLGQLPVARQPAFAQQVVMGLPDPVTVDYVRLNIDARRPA